MIKKLMDIIDSYGLIDISDDNILQVHYDVGERNDIKYYIDYNKDVLFDEQLSNRKVHNYLYFMDVGVQLFGINIDTESDNIPIEDFILHNDINDTLIIDEPNPLIENNINSGDASLMFEGKYEGELREFYVIDEYTFYIIVYIKGVKDDGNVPDEAVYILEAMEKIEKNDYKGAYIAVYNALEILIKDNSNINRLEPRKTKEILVKSGFNCTDSDEITKKRNITAHPKSYEFNSFYEELLEKVIDAFIYMSNKYN